MTMPYKTTEKERAKATAYNAAHRQERTAYQKRYREKYRVLVNATRLRRKKLRLESDPNFHLLTLLRSRLYNALRGKTKSARTFKLLGCTIDFLWAHLEKQFVPGMTRENYGPVWHVDHILPCAEFHLQHSEEQEICFHWTNLQPLFAADNLSKGDKII